MSWLDEFFGIITREKKLSSEAYTYQCSNLQYVDHLSITSIIKVWFRITNWYPGKILLMNFIFIYVVEIMKNLRRLRELRIDDLNSILLRCIGSVVKDLLRIYVLAPPWFLIDCGSSCCMFNRLDLGEFHFFLKMAFEFYELDSCNFIDWIALTRRVLLSWRFAAFNTLKKVMKYFLLKIMSHKLWRMKFTVPMSSGHFKIRHIIGLVLYSLENISRTVVYSCIIGIEFLYVITSCKLSHEYHGIGRSKFSFQV